MSWRAYEILTFHPDFTTAPRQGMVDERESVALGGSAGFVAWPDRTDRLFNLSYQTMTQREWQSLRDFFDRHSGRARAFYLPSWTADFELAADAPYGANTLSVVGNGLSSITENRPDTIGRRLLIYSPAGQSSDHWVVEASAAGANDTVVIEPPLPYGIRVGKTGISICYLVRLVDDSIKSDHSSPRHARMDLAFREISQRRHLDQTELAAGPVYFTLEANEFLVATDQDPLFTNSLLVDFDGPLVYGFPQAFNYESAWSARLDTLTNLVTLTNPTGGTSTSALYNALSPASQLAGMFDASGREIIAWERLGQITVGRYVSSTPTWVTFTGLTPVCFNTYAIDGSVDAGTATAAIFYLKRQDPTIYCRFAVEDFATEHRFCNSPTAPLALHAAIRNINRIELVGMDTNHRLARWISATYPSPPPRDFLSASISPTMTGDLMEITVPRTTIDTVSFAMIDPTITGEIQELAYRYTVPTEPMGKGRIEPTITGDYTSVVVGATATDSVIAVVIDNTMTGDYSLVAKTATTPDTANAKIETTITGAYS